MVFPGEGLWEVPGTRWGVGTRIRACRLLWAALMAWLVGVYLRETRRVNKDGSVVRYLQLAHNERHPRTGSPVAKVIHNFGRADTVDRDALARLVASISRFLEPEQAVAAAAAAGVDVLDSRRMGGAWVLGQLWERLEIGRAVRRVAAGRRLDGQATERVIFALVAQRALEPASKLAATRWVAERVAVEGCAGFSDDQAYRAMDFLLAALEEIAGEIFGSVAHLLNLDLDIVFVDTTSTYWECEVAGEPGELAEQPADDQENNPAEAGIRTFGHSKDHRDDLPQVVIALAVTRDGIPVRCWPSPATPATRRSSAPSRTAWTAGTCAAWSGSPTAGSPPPPTAPTSPGAAGTTSTPRSCGMPAARPRPRWPARAATTPSPGTCGSRKPGCPRAGTEHARSGS